MNASTLQTQTAARIDWTELRKSLVSDEAKSAFPSSIKLPVLPKALLEFSEKAKDPDADIQELSRIISTDSGLSSGLLRRANSAQVGSKARVTSVQQALVMFGVKATQLRLSSLGVQEVMKSSSSQLINFQNFWNTNLERALFARELAELLHADADLAFTASMLQDFMLPLLTNKLLDEYLEFAESPQQYENLIDFENQRFGWNHAQAAANVMCAWKFPDELICCVCLHHRGLGLRQDSQLGRTSLAAVAIASLLPDALQQQPDSMQKLLQLERELDALQLVPVAEKIDADFQQVAQNVQNHFSLLHYVERASKQSGQLSRPRKWREKSALIRIIQSVFGRNAL